MLYDQHGRLINYMRLAVTDRCNLRCQYCMPECGIKFTTRENLLTYEEMIRLAGIFAAHGVKKIRITGGEPFVRKNLIDFLGELSDIPGIEHIHITTNGTLLTNKIDMLYDLGIRSVNLSLDSLDKDRFYKITRRDELDIVLENMRQLLAKKFEVKINMVVMSNKNIDDIIPLLELARDNPISVRFLEEMPFNGVGEQVNDNFWSHIDILNYIQTRYPDIEKLVDEANSTSVNYRIKGFTGSFGIIASFSRTFCGSCNRIRITPQGTLRTCLYDNGVFNMKDMMRAGATDTELISSLRDALSYRAKDGHEAETRRQANPITESMATIGG